MKHFKDKRNRALLTCECCGNELAVIKDYRNMYEGSEAECVSSFRVCDKCFKLSDVEFWKTYRLTEV